MRLARVNQAKNHPGRKLSEPGETTIPQEGSQPGSLLLAGIWCLFLRTSHARRRCGGGTAPGSYPAWCWSKLRNSLSRLQT